MVSELSVQFLSASWFNDSVVMNKLQMKIVSAMTSKLAAIVTSETRSPISLKHIILAMRKMKEISTVDIMHGNYMKRPSRAEIVSTFRQMLPSAEVFAEKPRVQDSRQSPCCRNNSPSQDVQTSAALHSPHEL